MFAAILVTILLGTLWSPSWIALKFVKRLSARATIRKAWPVWLAQVCLAVAFIFLADAIGLTNPVRSDASKSCITALRVVGLDLRMSKTFLI